MIEEQTPAPVPGLRERGPFLNMCGLFEGGIALLALGLGWLLSVDPLESLSFDEELLLWGVLGTVPLAVIFLPLLLRPFGPMRKIKQMILESLGPGLSSCHWYDLILLSALVGFSEELMFRGFLQPWLERFDAISRLTALILSNVIFGLLHCITLFYTVLVIGIGIYLGWLLDVSHSRSLLIPIITHGFYDYLAFLVVVRAYRQSQSRE